MISWVFWVAVPSHGHRSRNSAPTSGLRSLSLHSQPPLRPPEKAGHRGRRERMARPDPRRGESRLARAWAPIRILFDNGTPRGVDAALPGHIVEEARSRGWDTLRNGELLEAAAAAGFDVFGHGQPDQGAAKDAQEGSRPHLTLTEHSCIYMRRTEEGSPQLQCDQPSTEPPRPSPSLLRNQSMSRTNDGKELTDRPISVPGIRDPVNEIRLVPGEVESLLHVSPKPDRGARGRGGQEATRHP